LPKEIAGDSAEPVAEKTESSLWGYEKALIVKALKDAGWNQTRAAKTLGISRDNLRYRIKKFEIARPD
jgi:transcriptional regulator with GAF, ATPase, and Fis domain